MTRVGRWVFTILALLTFGFCCLADLLPIELLFRILAGWIMFLFRVVPQIELDSGALLLSCGALLLFVIGLHAFLGWLSSAASRGMTAWKFRWTMCIVALTLLMFIAGISFVGVTRQVVWLAMSKEPILTSNGYVGSRMQSGNNLKQLALGVENYNDTFSVLPPGATINAEGQLLHSWMTFLLPFCEQRPLFERIDLKKRWDDPAQGDVFHSRIKYMESPHHSLRNGKDEQGRPLTHYAGNLHVLGGTDQKTMATIGDGAANTILAGEAAANFVPWGKPGNWRDPALGINRSPNGFGGPWQSSAMFAFVDGHVQRLSPDIAPEVLRALATPNGGERIPDDY